ncbi:MAG: hypothetical protein FHOMOCKG_00098 [Methanophagales virus GBV302]|uniref:Uncharacterized protein n=1 Tax=Methanophagales virus GBV302 TaxID=2999281 RepID=A0A9E9A682_9CAUD|nr:MAG: hypothetical protein QIT37_gp098 [Methanophagales virus GBV302]WAE39626.1 MAG: hypothetical protein FHOMOCKG_00098 [Methanophagales virus GBV302]
MLKTIFEKIERWMDKWVPRIVDIFLATILVILFIMTVIVFAFFVCCLHSYLLTS